MNVEQPPRDLQEWCEAGQAQLMLTNYIEAEALLAGAERAAWAARDWDTLARLYMPLQEARRQRRQRCGEGVVRLDVIAAGPGDPIDGGRVVAETPHGQLLVAGWGSIEQALAVRERADRDRLYVETFLAAVFPIGAEGRVDGRVVVIVPLADVRLPAPAPQPIDALLPQLPAHSVVLAEAELSRGARRGTTETYAEVMGLWERLHLPFLAAADAQPDPVQRMAGYRTAIRVDAACELAHQRLSDAARQMMRR